MKFLSLCLLVFTMLFAGHSEAAYNRLSQNVKLPNQVVLERYVVVPAASSAGRLKSAAAGPAGAGSLTYTSFVAQPDVPRNIIVKPGTSSGSTKAGTLVVTGTNYFGQVISENFAITDGLQTPLIGAKAFATVTSVLIPAENSPYAATWDIGTGDKIGLQRCMVGTGEYIKGIDTGVAMTGETIAASATAVESNTAQPNPIPNGTKSFEFYYIQNFACP